MRRGAHLTTIGLGGVLTMLLGSGLVALVTDTAASSGNQVLSGTFTPQSHDVDIASVAVGTGGDCASATYAESAAAAFVVANVNLDSGSRIEQGADFCLKNAGAAAGKLSVQFTAVTDTETACSPNEDTLGADASCGTGSGELRPMLQPAVSIGTDTSDCTGLTQAAWSTYESGAQQLDASLTPGEICRVHLTLFQTPGAADATKAAAQSDEIRWTVSFVLKD